MNFFDRMERIRLFVQTHQWTVTLVAVGIVLSVLLFTIGLWRTLLLFVIVGIAAYFGMMLDKKGGDGVVRFFNDLFKQK